MDRATLLMNLARIASASGFGDYDPDSPLDDEAMWAIYLMPCEFDGGGVICTVHHSPRRTCERYEVCEGRFHVMKCFESMRMLGKGLLR